MDRGSFERAVVAITPIVPHDGMSGAVMQRARLRDGHTLVTKCSSPENDLFAKLLGGDTAREFRLWERGVLDALPEEVGHAVVGGWTFDGTTVVLMRDLGSRILGRTSRLTSVECDCVLTCISSMHRMFRGCPPSDLASLETVITTFSPTRLCGLDTAAFPVVATVLQGWEAFQELTPSPLHRDLAALQHDPSVVVDFLSSRSVTLYHGDLAPVNFAWSPTGLTLIDWSQAVAAPPEFDVARFALGCGAYTVPPVDVVLDRYRSIAGPTYDPMAMEQSLLAALLWFGWGLASGAQKRPRSGPGSLSWWLAHAERALARL